MPSTRVQCSVESVGGSWHGGGAAGGGHLVVWEAVGDRGSMVSADRYGDTLGASPGGRRGAAAGRSGRGEEAVCCSR